MNKRQLKKHIKKSRIKVLYAYCKFIKWKLKDLSPEQIAAIARKKGKTNYGLYLT